MAFTTIRCLSAGALVLAFVILPTFASTAHAKRSRHQPRVCTQTAFLQYRACFAELQDDYYTKSAFCLNDVEERSACTSDARAEKREAGQSCGEQLDARKALCDAIGEAPYAPDMDPSLFQDPRNISHPNPYFPLTIGNRWVYAGEGERIEIEILDATKRIAGIDCIVYRDTVTSDGRLVEDTDDWFALRMNGDAVYCGEEVKDFEYFEGDDPQVPELTAIDGRFKVGVDLAKSGTSFLGSPVVGQSYRQEWDPGNAEDIGKVLSNSYAYGSGSELDEFVPQALAEHMCSSGDCVVIEDRSTLSPDSFERKYYAKGVGKFLEVKPDDGEFIPIVECNVDPKCEGIPSVE